MLRLSKKADYAIIALWHLCQQRDQPTSCREIANKYSIPLYLLSNIMGTLSHHGIVESVRGVKGGYQLAIDPDELTMGALLEALEGPFGLTECMELPEGETSECKIEPHCPIRWPIKRLHDKFKNWLFQITFEEIINDSREYGPIIEGENHFYEITHLHG